MDTEVQEIKESEHNPSDVSKKESSESANQNKGEDINYPRGSEWRKWDLHIHTPSSDAVNPNDKFNETLIAKLREHNIKAIAITDHNTIDADRIKALRTLASDITIFPGVEVRCDKGTSNLHIILIFSEILDVDVLSRDFAAFFNKDAKTKEVNKAPGKDQTAKFDFKDIIDWAKHENQKAIITVHAGTKSNGIEEEISNATKFAKAIKSEIIDIVDILEVAHTRSIEKYENEGIYKPTIICSDNHSIEKENSENRIGKRLTWIKADPTFDGLIQAINYHKERIYLDEKNFMPPKLQLVNTKKNYYIDTVHIKKIQEYKTKETWFDVELLINNGLTVIIGNKGSGKSALSDIIAHACNCKVINDPSKKDKGSFLNSQSFRKIVTNNKYSYAHDYTVTVKFLDTVSVSKPSLIMPDNIQPTEYVKYLPQQYIEDTCNLIKEGHFTDEINELMFSYLKDVQDCSESTFSEYITARKKPSLDKISILKGELNTLNSKIINLEYKKSQKYKGIISANLEEKKHILKNLEIPIPEVKEPEKVQNNKNDQELDDISIEIQELSKLYTFLNSDLQMVTITINSLNNIQSKLLIATTAIDNFDTELQTLIKNTELEHSKFKLETNKDTILSNITEHLKKFESKKTELNKQLIDNYNIEEKEDKLIEEFNSSLAESKGTQEALTANEIKTLSEKYLTKNTPLQIQLINMIIKKNFILEKSTIEQQKYNEYKKSLIKQQEEIKTLKGVPTDKVDTSTICGLEKELEYISKQIDIDYEDLIKKINETVTSIFNEKLNIVNIYTNIRDTITNVLSATMSKANESNDPEDNPEIKFQANMIVTYELESYLIDKINKKTSTGKFSQSNVDSYIKDSIAEIGISGSIENIKIIEFIKKYILNQDIKFKKGQDDEIKLEFYNYITSLDYIDIEYQLIMGDRILEELSPGERGIVLLTFYLSLSKADIPLIIDQPEDNLDNQSVYKNLVNRIKSAKMKRQIIIVTHNPNIAIACDAEQVIRAKINKKDKKITYVSGGIENSIIKKHVIDVLEGTVPAFDIRYKRYKDEIENWNKNDIAKNKRQAKSRFEKSQKDKIKNTPIQV